MNRTLLPEGWPRPRGYANGVAAEGRMVFVAGQIGWDTDGAFPASFNAQVRRTLENTLAVLAEAGAGPEHVVRMTWYVVDKQEYLAGLRIGLPVSRLAKWKTGFQMGALGTLLGRLAHVALPRAGLFHDPDLGIDPMPEVMRDLTLWTERAVPDLTGWDDADLVALRSLAADAQGLLDGAVLRTCLVHSDLNPKNVLVDPATLEVTGLVDWEFAHAGSPYADLGNLLRHDRDGLDA